LRIRRARRDALGGVRERLHALRRLGCGNDDAGLNVLRLLEQHRHDTGQPQQRLLESREQADVAHTTPADRMLGRDTMPVTRLSPATVCASPPPGPLRSAITQTTPYSSSVWSSRTWSVCSRSTGSQFRRNSATSCEPPATVSSPRGR